MHFFFIALPLLLCFCAPAEAEVADLQMADDQDLRGEDTLDGKLDFFQICGRCAGASGNQLINFCLKFGDFHRNLVAFICNSGKNFIS